MTVRVGPKGQVVIPQQLRDQLGIRPGDEVDLRRDGGRLVLVPVRAARPLLGRFSGEPLLGLLGGPPGGLREGRS